MIVPWLPGTAGTDLRTDDPRDTPNDFADRVVALLDPLGLDRVPVLSLTAGAPFAHALAFRRPDRVTGIVHANPVLPTVRGDHRGLLDPEERLRTTIARHAPFLLAYMMSATLSRIDAGYDMEFLLRIMTDNPHDRSIAMRPETLEAFRAAFCATTRRGFTGFVHTLRVTASDWHELIEGCTVPARAFAGAHNRFYNGSVLTAFARDHPAMRVEVVADAGHLLLYQKPALLLPALESGRATGRAALASPRRVA